VFQEIRRLSDLYVAYANLGAFNHNCTAAVPYLRLSNPYAGFDAIQEIRCDAPLLIGCFSKKDGAGSACTVVNMSELEEVKTVDVRLKLSGRKIVAHPRGFPTELQPDAQGFVRLSLPSGEGVFVTID
jgi:hypothetical protein